MFDYVLRMEKLLQTEGYHPGVQFTIRVTNSYKSGKDAQRQRNRTEGWCVNKVAATTDSWKAFNIDLHVTITGN